MSWRYASCGRWTRTYLVALAKGYPPFRRAVCEEIIRNNARQNAVIGALPIPGADMPVMTANQARMVLNIAAAYGEELSMDRARELLGVLAAGFGLRALSRQAVKLVPVGGWAASAVIAYAGTVAMGRTSILYFERGSQRVGAEGDGQDQEAAPSRRQGLRLAHAPKVGIRSPVLVRNRDSLSRRVRSSRATATPLSSVRPSVPRERESTAAGGTPRLQERPTCCLKPEA